MSSHPFSYPTPEPVRLSVQTGGGRVAVRATDTDTSTVELTAHNDAGHEAIQQSRVEHDGDRIVIDVPRHHGLLRRSPQIAIDVTVPTGSSLDVRAESSDVGADGTYAQVRCVTGSGDIAVDTVEGEAQVKSGSGDLAVGRVGGHLDASTGSGDVALEVSGEQTRLSSGSGDLSIGRLVGEVVTKTGSGDVEVGVLAGSLQTKTGSGDLVVRRATSGSLLAQGATGDVNIGVEEGTAAWLDVSSVTGDVRQELGESAGPEGSQAQIEITVHTVSGDIRIHRS